MAQVMTAARPAAGTLEEFLAGAEQQAYRMARYALRDHELALDVVQDSMLKLVEHYAAKPANEWPALFFTIVNNRITDVRRGRGGLNKLVSLFAPRHDGEDGEVDLSDLLVELDNPEDRARANQPEHAAATRELRQAIERAVAKLPLRQRHVYLLRECQGFDIKDTAAILGCSEGAVKQHHFRAMQALRGLLTEVWSHDNPTA
ncbi:MAG: RNA polymerase sigma factor [Gammaproteobacteria bacterium]|nr:RNA polymerase sigma factor [Gammaproteobacteria bacterium]